MVGFIALLALAIILIIGDFLINLNPVIWITILGMFLFSAIWVYYLNKSKDKCLKFLLSYEYNELMVLRRFLNMDSVIQRKENTDIDIVQNISYSMIEKKMSICKVLSEFDSKRAQYKPPENNNIISALDVEKTLTNNEPSFYKLTNNELSWLLSHLGGKHQTLDRKKDLQNKIYEVSAFWINNSVYGDINDPDKKYWINLFTHIHDFIDVYERLTKGVKKIDYEYLGNELRKTRKTYY